MLTSRKIQGGKPINEKIRTDSRVKNQHLWKEAFPYQGAYIIWRCRRGRNWWVN